MPVIVARTDHVLGIENQEWLMAQELVLMFQHDPFCFHLDKVFFVLPFSFELLCNPFDSLDAVLKEAVYDES